MSLFATGIPVASAGPNTRPIILRVSVGRVKKGTEKQSCHPIKFPRSQQTAVDRIEIKVHGGSHHVHLYRPYNGEPVYPTYDCPFAVDFDHWQLVAATQTGSLDWRLHPGVGIMFEARQPLMIQTHFVNTGFLDVKGRASAKMRLHPMAVTPTAYAGAFFGQDRTVLVPPGTGANATTLVNRCTITGEGPNARDMTIMAFTGHYHFRGTRFQVYKVHTDGSLDPTPVYDHTGYADPEFKEYPPEAPLVLKAGEGIEWWCTYDNDPVRWNNQTFKFGPNTEMNEHCNLFGFYYPTDTPQEAIDCIHKADGMVRVVATD